jgi:hypothetical protein
VRKFRAPDPPKDFDPRLVNILKQFSEYLSEADAAFGHIQRSEKPIVAGSLPGQQLGISEHGDLSGLIPTGTDGAVNDDHTQYVNNFGRPVGQTVLGSSSTATSASAFMRLIAYNDPPISGTTNITNRAADLTLTQNAIVRADSFKVFERNTDYSIGEGFEVDTGLGFANVSLTGMMSISGSSSSSPVIDLRHTNAGLTAHTLSIRARSSQTGALAIFANSSGTEMSRIRASDGAFVGPVVGDHGGLSGLTDDDHTQYLLLAGRSGGQHIGSGTKPTSGNDADLSSYNRLYLGSSASESDAYVAGTVLSVKSDIDGTAATEGIQDRRVINITGAGAAGATTNTGLVFLITGGSGLTSGTLTVLGTMVAVTPVIPSGVTGNISGLNFTSAPSGAGIVNITGAGFTVVGSSDSSSTSSAIIGCLASVRALATFRAGNVPGANISQPVTQATAFDVIGGFANDTDVVTWSGLRISTGITAAIANKWSLDLTNTSTNMRSRIAHPVAIGFTPSGPSAVTAKLHLGAGTATAGTAPLKLTSGTNLTTAEAGAIEFTTDDFFATITTGAARKAFVLDDGTRLTAGRVPFATTNGRLTDDADFTFATDTLTVTKIAATTLTGLLTIADAIDIALDTTTGTKIGTATGQKLGFWNAAPIAQPTTAIAAATFAANTSGIADDTATFDGYTLGQVVKALRNAGLLA